MWLHFGTQVLSLLSAASNDALSSHPSCCWHPQICSTLRLGLSCISDSIFGFKIEKSKIPRCQIHPIRVSCVFQLRMAELGSLDRVLNTWGGQVETSRPVASSGTRACFLGIWRRLRRIPEISILQKWSWCGVFANMYLASIAMSRLLACLHLLWPEDMFTSTKIATLLGQHPLVSCKKIQCLRCSSIVAEKESCIQTVSKHEVQRVLEQVSFLVAPTPSQRQWPKPFHGKAGV